MATVPQAHREVNPQLTPTPYKRAYINPEAFGEGVNRALGNMANALGNTADILGKIQARVDDTKILALTNHSNEFTQQYLYDKENGYFYKTGKDAYGGSEQILKDYDKYMTDYINSAKLSPAGKQRAMETYAKLKQPIMQSVTAHDYKQGVEWSKNEAEVAKANYLNNAINMRNNPEELAKSLHSGYQIIEWEGELQNLDAAAINSAKIQYRSDFHEAVLKAKLAEGSLTATDYLEEHKREILPDRLPHYLNAVKNNELRYKSVDIANEIIAKSPNVETAMQTADSIEDKDMSDAVMQRIKKHYSEQEFIKHESDKQLFSDFYNKALQAQQSGIMLSYDDIPAGLDAHDQLSLMNYINSNYKPETDNQVWEQLYNMSVNNAQGFANEDLNRYRGYLTEGDYKSFVKKQQDIKEGKFYSNIKDDDKVLQEALKTIGLKSDGKQESAFNEIRGLTKELEARKGRKITDEELMNITNSLGYKGSDGVLLYKQIEKGMAKRTGFLRDVMNDFVYYADKHNGELPPDAEKYKIITNRLNQTQQEQKTQAQKTIEIYTGNSNYITQINAVTPKQNEQKVTTYFADTVAPQLSKKLGFDVRITSRYRNSAGSKHAEGRAVDVGMAKETPTQRIQIYEELVKLPYIKAIGTSDPNILAHFNGRTNKIVDETKYDRQHGTNHINHAHVTFFHDNELLRNNTVKIAADNGIFKL